MLERLMDDLTLDFVILTERRARVSSNQICEEKGD